jgi:broad specificity phosphatase PhoE
VTAQRLIFVRHGITAWNVEGRWQGRLDPPLSDAGRREATMVAARIADDPQLRPARIVTSPLARAAETAGAIARAVGVPVEEDARLMEIAAGEWEGHTHAELATSDARYLAWHRGPAGVRPPGGESLEETEARTRAVIEAAAADPRSPTVLVSHGGILRVVAHLLFEVAPERMWSLDVDNASISVAGAMDGSWRLERWNDAFHLLGREPTHVDEEEGRPLAL